MTNEEQKAYIAALIRERAGYEQKARGKPAEDASDEQVKEHQDFFHEQVAAVDAELKRIGYKAKPPAKRAAKRPASAAKAEKR